MSTFSPLTELVGTPIIDIDRTIIGHLGEIFFDHSEGRIAYVQIHLDVGSGEARKLTVPWSSVVRTDAAKARLQLRVHRSALDALLRTRAR